MGTTEEERVLEAFHARYQADLRAGVRRPPGDYLAQFPGHEERLRRELAMLEGEDTRPSSGGAETESRGDAADAADRPQRLAHYRLLERLGAGGQGEVFLAHDEHLERRVALKILHDHGGSSVERFVREAQAASRLDHQWICTIYDSGTADARCYIAMRYVPGRSLAEWVAAAREATPGGGTSGIAALPPSGETTGSAAAPGARGDLVRLLSFFEKCARALHAAHEAGLIHRDVKPGNILVAESGDPVLLDFGLAREVGGDGHSRSVVMGTPEYMSPEQLDPRRIDAGTGHLDRRTDVYSLGLTLYECLTLERPFSGVDWRERYARIMDEDPPDPTRTRRWLPRELAIVLRKAVEKDPDDRYATALELADDLRRIQMHEPIRARPVGPVTRARKWVRRNPVPAGLLALLVAAVGVLVALNRELTRVSDAERRAAGRARTQEQRASAALRDLASSSADQRFAEGRFRASRGDWEGALTAYRAAEAGGYADAVGLAVARADARIGLLQYHRARALLDPLADAERAGAHAGRVLVLRSEIVPRLRWTRSALASLREQGAIGAADAEYAHAMIARSVPALLAHLDAALDAAPVHRRARRLRALGLAFAARLEEAEREAFAYLRSFPRDPTAVLTLAWVRGVRRDPGSAEAAVEELGAQLPPAMRTWLGEQLTGLLAGTRLVDAGLAQLTGATALPGEAVVRRPRGRPVEAGHHGSSAAADAASAGGRGPVAKFRMPDVLAQMLVRTNAAVGGDLLPVLQRNAASQGLLVAPEPALYLLRGRALRRLGRPADALADLRRAWPTDSLLCGAGARLLAFAELAAVLGDARLPTEDRAEGRAETRGCARLLLDRYLLPESWLTRVEEIATGAGLDKVAELAALHAALR